VGEHYVGPPTVDGGGDVGVGDVLVGPPSDSFGLPFAVDGCGAAEGEDLATSNSEAAGSG